jgi:para-nitrobenzyl esterase
VTRGCCLLLLLCAATGCSRDTTPDAPQVRVGDELFIGRSGEMQPRIAAFLGVPFAEAPVGELRWQAPQPLRASAGQRTATEFAAACYQDDYNIDWYRKVGAAFGAEASRFRNPPFSEDCLYLNVWTPAPGADGKLPVMVWIHGGANRSGWSFEPNYRGENLAARGNVVVVSIAYRHGVFGFFGHPELEGVTNFGLLDQLAALQWVQEHITAFGGDAGNVTIFGESAGAANIGYLLASPATEGLFRRAISQSGGYQMLERRSLADLEALGETLAAALPGPPDLAGLRRLDSATILAAANSALKDHDWGPAVDGVVVPAPVGAQGLLRVTPVDLLIGTNRDEWYMYVGDDSAARDAAIDAMPATSRLALRALADSEASVRKGHDRAVTFANMVCPGYLTAGAVQLAGGRAWVYRFDRVRPGPGGERLLAYHGAEIPYVFDTHDHWLATDDADRRLTGTLIDYWANFARTGDPNAGNLPAWPAYDVAGARLMVLGDAIAPRAAPDHALCLEQANLLYGANP